MRLFEIDETYNVKPNKIWISLIPEFANLFRRDKGSSGDSDGRKKAKARKELSFIYFFCDFGSPLRDWLPEEKEKEALYYSRLTESDLKDEGLQQAIKKYIELQNKAARSMRTYNAITKGLDKLDLYLESVDFTETDKKGELKHDPDSYAKLIERMTKVYAQRREFEKFVEDDLKSNDDTIQGQRTLGDNEATKKVTTKSWSESDIIEGSAHAAENAKGGTGSFAAMGKFVTASRKQYSSEEIEHMQVMGEDEEEDAV